jgi:hypothetical protein
MVKSSAQHNYLLPSIKTGLNKKQIASLVEQSIKNVLEHGNAFQVVEVIAVMSEFIKGIRNDDRLVNYLREELTKYQGKYTTNAGAKIEACEVGIEYDYSNDASWVELDKAITELTEKKKALEERLRRIPAGKIIVEGETGEVFTGPAKSSKSSYKITLLKQ